MFALFGNQVVPNFRVRTIPVLGAVPAIFGMALAAYVLTELAGQPVMSDPVIPLKVTYITIIVCSLFR
jgi:hypothetical protein